MSYNPYNEMPEHRDPDIASDALDRIESFKEDVVTIIDAARHILDPEDFRYYAASMEEVFNDTWHQEWKSEWEICRDVNRENIPSCEALRMRRAERDRLRKQARDAELRIREANMATAKEIGMLP